MQQDKMKKVIDDYIKSYNSFDVDGMILQMHENISFQNISNGVVNMKTEGISEFRAAAEQAKQIFKSRCQTVTDYQFSDDSGFIEIDYSGEFAIDIPDGPKQGETLNMKGKSEFTFQDGLIIKLKDIS
ncbi:MAG: nuclear transport factor 2 family protein [Candidatus Electrothrix scaldis]|nr:MAG: nuclear transport factor 2 family protein [Candidatus Electrothrix sp. GW3-3]